MGFLKDTDYAVLIRAEISKIIDSTENQTKLLGAEKMAISQIKNHLAGRYDVDAIFTPAPDTGEDTRDQFIVMLVIDLALYHIWSKEGPNNIPKIREQRYNDALEWLIATKKSGGADLPPIIDETGNETGDVRIWSKNVPEENRY